jgi:prepilin-type N-terminal cleavage/methylation domain-containing protein
MRFLETAKRYRINGNQGFSLVELIVSMVITLIILGAAVTTFTSALNTRKYQSERTDAITSAQAAINTMSRQIGNAGFGLKDGILGSNGLVLADCNATRLHFRANTNSSNDTTSDPGEDVTFYYDASTQSIVRYDAANGGSASSIINQVSQVNFTYYNYASDGSSAAGSPSNQTARVTIKLTVLIGGDGNVQNPRNVTIQSDITLRNSQYGLGQY